MRARPALKANRFWWRAALIGVLVFLLAVLARLVSSQPLNEVVRYQRDDGFQQCIVYKYGQWEAGPLRLPTLYDVPRIEVNVGLHYEERGWPLISTKVWSARRESKIVKPWDDAQPDLDVAGLMTESLRGRIAGGSNSEFAPLVRMGLQSTEDVDLRALRINFAIDAALNAIPALVLYCMLAVFVRVVLLKWYGRGRCRKCGYDLVGLATGICPECGSTFVPRTAEATRTGD